MTSGKSVGTPHQRHRSGQHFYSTRVESSRMFNTISGFGGHSPSAGTPAASPDGSMEVHRRNEQAPRRRVTHGKQRHHLIPPLLPSRSAGATSHPVPRPLSCSRRFPTATHGRRGGRHRPRPGRTKPSGPTWVNRPGPDTGDPPRFGGAFRKRRPGPVSWVVMLGVGSARARRRAR